MLIGEEFTRILLINPPVYDVRLEWSRWHKPTGLLQVASWLQEQGKEVKLIDCLYTYQKRLPYEKIDTLLVGDYQLNKRRYGLSFSELTNQVKKYLADNWYPDAVFITSLNSIWWEATRDTITRLRKILPKAKFILGGVYPTVAYKHAVEYSGADDVIAGGITEAANLRPDLSLYEKSVYSTGIYFYNSRTVFDVGNTLRPRPLDKIVDEILADVKLGVREFLFFDEEIHAEDAESFSELLDEIAKLNLQAHFILPGNISPRTITPDLAHKMHQARLDRVYLRCDLHFGQDRVSYTTPLSTYQECVGYLLENPSFKPRQENIAAMLVVGFPFEDLEEVTERLIQLAHIAGSVILVPFQYVPGLHQGSQFDLALTQNGHLSLEDFNSKLFPLARCTGKSFEDYMELMRLTTLLNSKYHGKTFDFLGSNLAAKLFRESIRTEGWNPFRAESGTEETLDIIPLKSR